MRNRFIAILRGAMLLLFLASVLLTSVAASLRLSVFNPAFYQGIARRPEYATMVSNAIRSDLADQSRYVGIDFSYLSDGLDNNLVAVRIEMYYRNLVAVMTDGSAFQRVGYPQDPFYARMTEFIDVHAQENGYTPSEEQYALLQTVARDSAAIAARHINLVDMNDATVRKVSSLLLPPARRIAGWAVYLLLLSVLLAAAVAFLYRGQMDDAIRNIATMGWIAGVLIAVPAIVMEIFQFSSRIAIHTIYVRYFVDRLLSSINGNAMTIGLCLFGISGITKIVLFLRRDGHRIIKLKRRRMTRHSDRIDSGFSEERKEI